MNFVYISLIILAIQIAFFVFAATLKTDKVTDLAYGLTFVLIALGLYVLSTQELAHLMLLTMIAVRGVRLAGYLFVRILHMGTDRRFDTMRETWTDFAKFWVLQTVAIFVLLLPVIFVMQSKNIELHRMHWTGVVIFIIGFAIESISDQQKWNFKKAHPTQHCMVGLRSRARHPNYFGEILIWLGIFIFSLYSLSGREYIAILSPISIFLLLRYISGVPLLIKQRDKRYGDTQEYQTRKKQTNMFVPF